MDTEQLTIRVELPRPGDMDFEVLVEQLAEAVYQRVKERLQHGVESAQIKPSVI